MTEFQKYILLNHPDPDSLIGTVNAFDQICRLAESYALSKVKKHDVLADVSGSFTAEQMKEAHLDGVVDGYHDEDNFNIDNYR